MMNPNRVKAFTIIILIWACVGRQIEVPAIHDNTPIMLKLGATKIVNQPDFKFQKIYSKNVQKVDGNSIYRFGVCQENRAEVQFDILDEIQFEGIPKRPLVIYDFNDIRYSQFILDVYYENPNIFIMFKNYKMAVVSLDQNNLLKEKKLINVEGATQDNFMEIGYFLKLNKQVLFVNNNYVIKVSKQQARVIQGYEPLQDFQTAVAVDNNLFAIAGIESGIVVYRLSGNTLAKVNTFKPDVLIPGLNATDFQLVDLVYWKQKQTFITLDTFYGVKTYRMTKDGQNVNIKQTQPISNISECRLMYIYESTLYVYCGRMRVYVLDKWPTVVQKTVPYPNVQVKQIYQFQDIVAFVGRNSFTLVYLDHLVNYFEDKNLDKLLLFKQLFISTNEQGLDIGKLKLIPAYINCNTNNEDFLGTSNLVFKTKAQCNDEYFEQFSIDKLALGQISSSDICVYTVYKPITIWKAGQINILPFFIALIVVLAITIAVVLLYVLKKVKLDRYKKLIEQFSTNAVSDSAKHQELAQELDGGVSQKIKEAKKEQGEQGETNKVSEVQLAENMHDI